MPKFTVYLSETTHGTATVEAATQAEAEAKAWQLLEDVGLEAFDDFNPQGTEWYVDSQTP